MTPARSIATRMLLLAGAAAASSAVMLVAWTDQGGAHAAHYAIPGSVAILFWTCSALSAVARAKVILLTASVLGMLWFLEALAEWRLLSPEEVKFAAARRIGVAFDSRTDLAVLRAFRAGGDQKAVRALFPRLFLDSDGCPTRGGTRLFPLGSISRRLTILCNEDGVYSAYRADRFGFNNPEDAYASSPPDVVLIGDSFVQGACVHERQDIGSQLRHAGLHTLGFGMSATGGLAQLAALREYGLPLRPRTVLWFHFEGNDLADTRRELVSPTLMRYLEDPAFSQDLRHRQPEVDAALDDHFERELARASTTTERQRISRVTPGRVLTLDVLVRQRLALGNVVLPFSEYGRILAAARAATLESGARFYVVYLPMNPQARGWFASAPRARIRRLLESLGIDPIDFTAIVESTPVERLFPFGVAPHYTAHGYALLAGLIVERLRNDGVLEGRRPHGE